MPFTLAHPALILPAKNVKWFSLTALIVGSMVPDLEFFFQLREVENIGHHWYGIALFDIPVGLLFCFLFHNVLRTPLLANLPAMYRSRFAAMIDFNWNPYARSHKLNILVSLLAGIATHILCDGFTHYNGMFVLLFPVLQQNVPWVNMPAYFVLQILFSAVGMLAVGLVILGLPAQPRNMAEEQKKSRYWFLMSFLFALMLSVRCVFWPQYNSFWGIIMAIMGAFLYSLLVTSFVFQNTFKKQISL